VRPAVTDRSGKTGEGKRERFLRVRGDKKTKALRGESDKGNGNPSFGGGEEKKRGGGKKVPKKCIKGDGDQPISIARRSLSGTLPLGRVETTCD